MVLTHEFGHAGSGVWGGRRGGWRLPDICILLNSIMVGGDPVEIGRGALYRALIQKSDSISIIRRLDLAFRGNPCGR